MHAAHATPMRTESRRLAAFSEGSTRFARRHGATAVWVALGAGAVYFLAPQAGHLAESLQSLRDADWRWIAVAVVLLGIKFLMAALSLRGAAGDSIRVWTTTLAQVSTAFVGRLTPEGIGWLVLNQRYLERAGLDRVTAAAALGVRVFAGAVVRVALLVVVVLPAGVSLPPLIEIRWSPAQVLAVLAIAVTVAAIAARLLPRLLRATMGAASTTAANALGVVRSPRRALELVGGSILTTLAYALILHVSVLAVGAEVTAGELFVVYLVATAIASTSPIPGNLGALEVAFTVGLTGLGVSAGAAFAAAVVYRLVTFWLPIIPGLLTFRYLQSRQLL